MKDMTLESFERQVLHRESKRRYCSHRQDLGQGGNVYGTIKAHQVAVDGNTD